MAQSHKTLTVRITLWLGARLGWPIVNDASVSHAVRLNRPLPTSAVTS